VLSTPCKQTLRICVFLRVPHAFRLVVSTWLNPERDTFYITRKFICTDVVYATSVRAIDSESIVQTTPVPNLVHTVPITPHTPQLDGNGPALRRTKLHGDSPQRVVRSNRD